MPCTVGRNPPGKAPVGNSKHRTIRLTRRSSQGPKEPAPDSSIESLFAKELQRRGMSMDEDGDTPATADTKGAFSSSAAKSPFAPSKQASSTSVPPAPKLLAESDQRARSMALVNEGLEGLIPRASQLVQLGLSVALGFLPLVLAFSLAFGSIYAFYGNSFVHGGDRIVQPRQYLDPDVLLNEPTVDPMVPF